VLNQPATARYCPRTNTARVFTNPPRRAAAISFFLAPSRFPFFSISEREREEREFHLSASRDKRVCGVDAERASPNACNPLHLIYAAAPFVPICRRMSWKSPVSKIHPPACVCSTVYARIKISTGREKASQPSQKSTFCIKTHFSAGLGAVFLGQRRVLCNMRRTCGWKQATRFSDLFISRKIYLNIDSLKGFASIVTNLILQLSTRVFRRI
jgi:hypothetical protein